MSDRRFLAVAGIVTVGAGSLTGCSVDAMIWGPDGAAVIRATDAVVEDMTSGIATDLVCDDATPELGTAADWQGLSAGEPERFRAEYWEDLVPLDPQWNINLEGLPDGAVQGDEFPGDIFYRETDEGLCVVEVVWSTLVWQG